MKQGDFIALVRAHYRADHVHFRAIVRQVAARAKAGPFRDELNRQGAALIELPQEARKFAHPLKPVDVESLVLTDELSDDLHEIAREHEHRTKLAVRGLEPRCRLLFHGPPGNGKTSAAAILCGLVGLPAYWVSIAALVDSHMGVTGTNLTQLLPVLKNNVALVLDEIDAIGHCRGSSSDGANREQNAIVNVILTLLDHTDGGLLIATTNRRDMLDPALLRRFDAELEFPVPRSCDATKLHTMLSTRFAVRTDASFDARSYDAITKSVKARARRAVLQEVR